MVARRLWTFAQELVIHPHFFLFLFVHLCRCFCCKCLLLANETGPGDFSLAVLNGYARSRAKLWTAKMKLDRAISRLRCAKFWTAKMKLGLAINGHARSRAKLWTALENTEKNSNSRQDMQSGSSALACVAPLAIACITEGRGHSAADSLT